MDIEELYFAEAIFSHVRDRKVYNQRDLIKKISDEAKLNGVPLLAEFKHLCPLLEEMGLIRIVNVDNGKVHLYITKEGLNYKYLIDALNFHSKQAMKRYTFIDLEIKRATWDIRTAKYGWIAAAFLGAFLKDGLVWLWEVII